MGVAECVLHRSAYVAQVIGDNVFAIGGGDTLQTLHLAQMRALIMHYSFCPIRLSSTCYLCDWMKSLCLYYRKHQTDLWVSWGAGVLIAIFIFWRDAPLRLTYDSHDYLAASWGLDAYLKGTNAEGYPYLVRQPLLPAYLHTFDNKSLAASWLNVVCFALSVFLCLKIAQHARMAGRIRALFIITVVSGLPFLQNFFFLWTEPLFIVLTLLTYYCLITHQRLSVIIVLVVLAYFCRKAGGFVFLSTLAVLLQQRKERAVWITAAVFLVTVMAWEAFTLQYITASASLNTWLHAIGQTRIPYVDSISSWFAPRLIPLLTRVLLLLNIGIMLWIWSGRTLSINRQVALANPLMMYGLTYIVGLLFFGGPAHPGDADRFLSVAYPFVIGGIGVWVSAHLRTSVVRGRYLLLIWTTWLFYPLARVVHFLCEV